MPSEMVHPACIVCHAAVRDGQLVRYVATESGRLVAHADCLESICARLETLISTPG